MKRIKLTGIIIAKNEEENIANSLPSLKFCNEIIVIDDYSTDKTAEISRMFGARVYKRKLRNNFASQRNFAMSKAKNEWVFFLDADEIVSNALAKRIQSIPPAGRAKGFLIKRTDVLWGKKMKHGEVGGFKILRLGDKRAGVWKRKVHEEWRIIGKVEELKEEIFHYPHKTIKKFISDIGLRTLIHSGELKKEKKEANVVKVLVWPLGKFAVNYVFKLGFLDGVRGFILAVLMSFHSFLAWSEILLSK